MFRWSNGYIRHFWTKYGTRYLILAIKYFLITTPTTPTYISDFPFRCFDFILIDWIQKEYQFFDWINQFQLLVRWLLHFDRRNTTKKLCWYKYLQLLWPDFFVDGNMCLVGHFSTSSVRFIQIGRVWTVCDSKGIWRFLYGGPICRFLQNHRAEMFFIIMHHHSCG